MKLHSRFGLLLASLALACGSALASGLQVAPISVTLQPRENAQGLWLSNTGADVVHAQVRVYQWTQADGKNVLTPSRGLIVSPPMLEIKPGAKQLIRVIRTGAPPSGAGAVEAAYRLAIDELPIDTQGKKGLQFVLHYSVPVFVEPVGGVKTAPALQWQLEPAGDQATLQIGNHGSKHAQISQLGFVASSGKRTEVDTGLLGYVLPGATMRWPLKQPAATFTSGGTFEAHVNDAPTTQAVRPAGGAR